MQWFNLYGNSSLGLSDPYMMYALKSMNANNPAFKAQQTNAVQNTTSANTTAQSPQIAAQSVQPQLTQKESSNAGLWITGALGAAAIIGMVKGKSINPLKYYKGLLGGAEKSSTESLQKKLTNLQAVKGSDGEIRLLIPGKTVTLEGTEATKYAAKHNISTAPERIGINPQSNLQEFVFGGHVVTVKDGNIVSIKKGSEELFERFSKSTDEVEKKFYDHLQKVQTGLLQEKVDTKLMDSVTGIRYTNTFGDDIFEMSLAEYGNNPAIEKLTTLGRYKLNSPEVQQLVLKDSEAGFIDVLKNGKLQEGFSANFSETINGVKCNFEGKNLVSIETKDGVFSVDSICYRDFIKDNEKNVNKYIEKIFSGKEELPENAVIFKV